MAKKKTATKVSKRAVEALRQKESSRPILPSKSKPAIQPPESAELVPASLVDELRELIRTTRFGVAQSVNAALVVLYWRIGARIRAEVLKNERADYGKQIVSTLSRQLASEFGGGFRSY